MRLDVLHLPAAASPQASGFDTGPRSISAVKVLRISITDRCNFRCVYCMPADGVRWLAREDILRFEEICDVVRAAIDIHGIRRFKLTGGEPTVRHGLVELVGMIRRIPDVEDLSLTTNGQRLSELGFPLRDAGLDRITVSLDSLQAEKFKQITRTGDLRQVLRGIDQCEAAGFCGLKINCVTMRGVNDNELVDFARLSLSRRLTVRFIEYMPLGDAALLPNADDSWHGRPARDSDLKNHGRDARATPGQFKSESGRRGPALKILAPIDPSEIGPAAGCGGQDRGADSLLPESEVRETIEAKLGPLIPIPRDEETGVGPANVYRLALGNPLGRIGFISAMSAPFCATCNRLRLTANGVLRSCLFEGGEVDIRPTLRSIDDPALRRKAVAQAMTDCVRLKPELHGKHGNEQMSRIGG